MMTRSTLELDKGSRLAKFRRNMPTFFLNDENTPRSWHCRSQVLLGGYPIRMMPSATQNSSTSSVSLRRTVKGSRNTNGTPG